MPRSLQDQSALEGDQQSPKNGQPDEKVSSLHSEQLRRLAALIAEGSSEFPSDLSERDRTRLEGEVRQLLRARLITTFAEIITADIERQALDPSGEDRRLNGFTPA